MTPETFLAEFGHYADAPNGVQKLREFILQLAVQGKLVPQDPGETSSEDLIHEAKEKKQKLVHGLGLRRQAALQPLTQDDQPYRTPDSWSWVRMDDVFLVTGGIQKSPKRKPVRNHYPYLRVANVQRGRLDLGEIARFELAPGELEKLRLDPNDLLIVEGNGSEHEIGRCAVWSGEITDCVHQNHLIRCRPIHPEWSSFILLFLNSPQGIEEMKRLAITTSGLYNLSVGKIRGIACPIPPPQEQERIVAKVDQLMALCDELEARKQQRREAHVRLNDAALDALLNATDPDDFAAHWQRIGDHFDLLYDHPETIAKLRAAILQLAVQGKLVPQDPGDEPAEALLLRIAGERKRSKSPGKAKQHNRQGGEGRPDLPWPTPSGWVACGLSDVAMALVTGPFGSSLHKSDYKPGGIPVINPASLKDQRILPIPDMAVDESTVKRLSSFILETNDIVLARRGEMGRCALVRTRETGWLCGTGSVVLRLSRSVHHEFFVKLIGSSWVREYLSGASVGATMSNLNQKILMAMPIIVPPVTEQERIVAKVDQLMALCDGLEAKLTRAQEQSEKLMEATVRHFVGQAPKPAPAPAPAKPRPPEQQPLPTLESARPRKPRTAPNGNIPQAIFDHMQPGTAYSRADIVAALDISAGDWNWAIKQLKEAGKVAQTGQRRGARYSLAQA